MRARQPVHDRRSHGLLVALVVVALSGGVAEPDVRAEPPPPVARDVVVDTLHVEVFPPTLLPRHRWASETTGHVTVLVETFLADLSGVVPRVDGVPTTPGLARALPAPEPPWRLGLAVGLDGDALEVGATLCDHAGACTEHVARGERTRPNAVVAEVVLSLADRLDRAPTVPFEVWARPETTDDYIALIVGRAAATLEGYQEPVSGSERGNHRVDPVARAVFLDATMATAWVIYGRTSADPRRWLKAYTYAARARPESVALLAAHAGALEAAGHAAEAVKVWRDIDGMAPGDLRFLLPRASAALSAGRPERARAILGELGPRFADHPDVVRLRVDIADAEGRITDEVLARWQAADPAAVEPVRRRVLLRVREGRYVEALALTDELARRGAVEEANTYVLALANDLEAWEQAAEAAYDLGSPDVARRLLARNAPDSLAERLAALADASAPEARLAKAAVLVEAERGADALRELDVVLAHDPWWPEALDLRARALALVGDHVGAERALSRLYHADPLFAERVR